MQTLIPIAEKIGARLKDSGETIAIAETSAGGLISAALLAVPGASAYYRGGGIIYARPAFYGLMGLKKEDVEHTRSSTEPYARILAATIQKRCRTTWGLSETGASGPTGNIYGDDAGHTCTALIGPDTELSRTLETGLSDRAENMRLFAMDALELLLEQLG